MALQELPAVRPSAGARKEIGSDEMAKKIPLRQCLGCREMVPKNQLIRIVRDGSGDFAVDLTGKANGRGAYICKSAECLNMAVKSKALERAFKVSIPDEVYKDLDKELQNIEKQ